MIMDDKFDKQGNPLSLEEWAKKMEDAEYKILKQQETKDGKWVSTVWLGLNHNIDNKMPPLIFETMVFTAKGSYEEVAVKRYCTEEEAMEGHNKLFKKYNK